MAATKRAGGNPEIDLAYRLLDLDLIDSEGRRCGKVDEMELMGGPGELTYLAAIRTGPGVLPRRFPPRLRGLARRLFGGRWERVPSARIEDFSAAVTLNATARELGLGSGDRAVADFFHSPQREAPE